MPVLPVELNAVVFSLVFSCLLIAFLRHNRSTYRCEYAECRPQPVEI